MARIEHSTWNKPITFPRWAGDPLHPQYLVRGGAKLDPDAFDAGDDGRVYVPAGTIVGRTFDERDAGEGLGPVAFTEADEEASPPVEESLDDDEVFILAHDVQDATVNNDATLVRPGAGFTVKVNFLPGWDELPDVVKEAVIARYFTTIGAE